jgi:tetratricopeptide (TPR) repeat protein
MRIRSGVFLALAAGAVLGACAPAAGNGVAGAPRPAETRFTTAAKLQLAQAEAATGERQQELYQQALQQSLQGIEAAPNNPQHFYLAGVAHSGLNDFEAADTMWNRALEMFPAYEGEVMVAREQAWAQAFNQGVIAYNAGNHQEAVRYWEQANAIFDRRPEAYFNLAAVYSQEERYDDAIGAFRSAVQALEREPGRELTPEEVADRDESLVSALQNLGNLQLFTEQFTGAEQTFRRLGELQPDNVQARANLAAALARQGRRPEAMTVYQELMGMPNLTPDQMMSVGVGLFQAQEFGEAAQAFRRITETHPNNRDAWYNHLNALYALQRDQETATAQRWQEVIQAAERLLELDPLNENAHLILIQAYRDTRRQQDALRIAERNQAQPIHIDEVQIRQNGGRAVLQATATGNRAPAGSAVNLEFTFYGPGGQTLGTQRTAVSAPAQNASTRLEVSIPTETMPTGFRYRVVQ